MADHVRTQIRDRVVDLTDNLTTTLTRCYAARPKTRPLQTLPALIVYTNDETIEIASGQRGSRRLIRPLSLVIEAYAEKVTDVDQQLDTINAEVEAAISADPTLNGLAKDVYISQVEKEQDDEGEKPTWLLRMTYYVEYHTRETAPTAALA